MQAQTDVTSKYIKNASLEQGFKNWTSDQLQLQSNTDFAPKQGVMYAEKWVQSGTSVGSASLGQLLTGLPAGKYTLTAGAQNLNQQSTSAKCAGAYIYADNQQTSVYTPGDYSVSFTTLTGQVKIGFKAVNAQGNWIAVDNFRLYKTEDIETEVLVDALQEQLQIADQLLQKPMEAWVKDSLTHVAAQARALGSSTEQASLQAALVNLNFMLDKANLAVLLANATPGTGTAPYVSVTNHYVPTGATEALMRATMTASNVKERGVCWSTEHNPTVLDSRTTEYYSLNGNIYHITGLKPATVYYLRPYVMNATYTVAYGDEVKIVTHPKGNCTGSWNNGAPTDAANLRCRNAIDQTIEYFNEWTGIQGFSLTGQYGSGTPTADCNYGGSMHIGPNAAYQAIGTVIHETGHGVGVGTSDRWWNTNFHDWKWLGRETTTMYQFLENKMGNANYYMVGDNTHGWGENASYDWFVNGADKDRHLALQYIGGCALLYSYFIDGLCPTRAYHNGLPGYTYNFEDTTTYYLMCKDAERGLNTGLLATRESFSTYRLAISSCLNDQMEIPADAAWQLEFDAKTGYYLFKHKMTGMYLTHGTSQLQLNKVNAPTGNEKFQLMPDRTDVTVTNNGAEIKTHGYWLTWYNQENKAVSAPLVSASGICVYDSFDETNAATKQQWIILTAEEVARLKPALSAIETLDAAAESEAQDRPVYNLQGQRVAAQAEGWVIKNGHVQMQVKK